MKVGLLAYLAACLVIGALVALMMTRETDTEKQEQKAQAEEADRQPAALPGEITPGPRIAERVVRIRRQSFAGEPPAVKVVPEAELEAQLAELDRQPPESEELANATAILLAQAGALPAEKAKELAARRYGGTGVLGAYLPESRAVLVGEELAEREPEIAELVAARELSRALDAGSEGNAPRLAPLFADDEAAAVTLRAGAATVLEREYAVEHLRGEPGAESEVELSRRSRMDPATPALLRALATLPAEIGDEHVSRLHERGGWDAVDEALGDPPATTAELLHDGAPEVPTPEFDVGPALGSGWSRLARADVGELDTIALLRSGLGERPARRAAAGWRAGRMETWTQKGAAESCAPPCRDRSASVVVWRFAGEGASLAFVRALRRALVEATPAEAEGGQGFRLEGAGAAVVRAGRFAALTFAPDAPQAGELAQTALEG